MWRIKVHVRQLILSVSMDKCIRISNAFICGIHFYLFFKVECTETIRDSYWMHPYKSNMNLEVIKNQRSSNGKRRINKNKISFRYSCMLKVVISVLNDVHYHLSMYKLNKFFWCSRARPIEEGFTAFASCSC